MRISPFNKISFKSTPIYNVKLKQQNEDGSYSELPATFSKLSYSNKQDRKTVRSIRNSWYGTKFAKKICNDFFDTRYRENDKDDFYIIERKNERGGKEVFSILEFYNPWNYVTFLQSNPRNKKDGLKGSGELILWGIGKEKEAKDDVVFYLAPTPESKRFYKHIGLKDENGVYVLTSDYASEFLEEIEQRYNLNSNPSVGSNKNEN